MMALIKPETGQMAAASRGDDNRLPPLARQGGKFCHSASGRSDCRLQTTALRSPARSRPKWQPVAKIASERAGTNWTKFASEPSLELTDNFVAWLP